MTSSNEDLKSESESFIAKDRLGIFDLPHVNFSQRLDDDKKEHHYENNLDILTLPCKFCEDSEVAKRSDEFSDDITNNHISNTNFVNLSPVAALEDNSIMRSPDKSLVSNSTITHWIRFTLFVSLAVFFFFFVVAVVVVFLLSLCFKFSTWISFTAPLLVSEEGPLATSSPSSSIVESSMAVLDRNSIFQWIPFALLSLRLPYPLPTGDLGRGERRGALTRVRPGPLVFLFAWPSLSLPYASFASGAPLGSESAPAPLESSTEDLGRKSGSDGSNSDTYVTLDDGTVIQLRAPLHLSGARPSKASSQGFIVRRGHQLVNQKTGRPFYFLGFNAHWLPSRAAFGHEYGRRRVTHFLQTAKNLGLKAVRVWGFNRGVPAAYDSRPDDSLQLVFSESRDDSPAVRAEKKGLREHARSYDKGVRLRYSEQQLRGLDFVIYVAGQLGLRVIIALGNLWYQYKGPEEYLYMATGSAEGKTILDFYSDSATKKLYEQHMAVMTNRVNAYTGVSYKDDPAILAWDVMNEPRCPGCTTGNEKAIHNAWLKDMARALKKLDPKHLVAFGTEGYFDHEREKGQEGDKMRKEGQFSVWDPKQRPPLHLLNPGAGASCEGDDWVATSGIPEVDVAMAHVYERQLERLPYNSNPKRNDPSWLTCDFTCYINFFVQYTNVHINISASLDKPFIIEEFGLTWKNFWEHDRRVLLQVAFEMVISSSRQNGALAGVMFWNAADEDTSDPDGYNVYLTSRRHTKTKAANSGLFKFQVAYSDAALGWNNGRFDESVKGMMGPENSEDGSGEGREGGGEIKGLEEEGASEDNRGRTRKDIEEAAKKPEMSKAGNENHHSHNDNDEKDINANDDSDTSDDNIHLKKQDVQQSSRKSLLQLTSKAGSRQLLDSSEGLDGFRRKFQRHECAAIESKTWRPPAVKRVVDYDLYHSHVDGLDAIDVIQWASSQIPD